MKWTNFWRKHTTLAREFPLSRYLEKTIQKIVDSEEDEEDVPVALTILEVAAAADASIIDAVKERWPDWAVSLEKGEVGLLHPIAAKLQLTAMAGKYCNGKPLLTELCYQLQKVL